MRCAMKILAGTLALGAMSVAQSTTNGTAASGGNASSSTASDAAGRTGAAQTGATLRPQAEVRATLQKSVDTKKAKPGDEVVAKIDQDVTAGGKVVIAKGSRLMGHVTEAASKNAGNGESKLGIVFDKAVSKGQEVPLHGTIVGVTAVESTPASADFNGGSELGAGPGGAGTAGGASARGSGGLGGNTANGVGNTGRTVGAAGNPAGDIGAQAGNLGNQSGNVTSNAAGNANTIGVIGMNGVTLRAATDTQNGSVLISNGKNIHLDSGTQLVLGISGAAQPRQ